MMKDPYQVLGVASSASDADIKKAYRKLARELHPDLHPGDKAAETRFKEVSAAYGLVSDTDKRREFDEGLIDAAGQPKAERTFYREHADAGHGAQYHPGGDPFGGIGEDDLFANLFRQAGRGGGGRGSTGPGGAMRFRGADVRYALDVDFLDAVKGAAKELALPDGKNLRVTIPAGAEDGQILRLKGQGMAGHAVDKDGAATADASLAGDAHIELHVRAHRLFSRKGRNIHIELPITLPEAVLGGRIEVPTIDGPVTMTVPKGSNTGATLRLKERGVPGGGGKDAARGDQFVTLKVMLPDKPDAALEAAIKDWAEKHPYDVRQSMKGAA